VIGIGADLRLAVVRVRRQGSPEDRKGASVRVFTSICVIAVAIIAAGIPVAGADDPAPAVFLLEVIARNGVSYQSAVYGTAFFISGDGTALTNSHVVYLAQREPERYQLLAVVNREFYSASIVCASRLQHDPTNPGLNIQPGRDVAKIRVSPSTFPFAQWGLNLPSGQRLLTVTAHRASLPRFPTLTVAGRPSAGDQVRVIGFGHLFPGPPGWTATGQVLGIDHTADGTEIFGVDFSGPVQPGNSGSPVLNPQDQVIGMWTWYSLTDANIGMAIGNSAFLTPCL
jgi:S1-C subfamily serine protease